MSLTITPNHAILTDVDRTLLPAASDVILPEQQKLAYDLERQLNNAFGVVTTRALRSVDIVLPGVTASTELHSVFRMRGEEPQFYVETRPDIPALAADARDFLRREGVPFMESLDDLAISDGVHVQEKDVTLALIFGDKADKRTQKLVRHAARMLHGMSGLGDAYQAKDGVDASELFPTGKDKGLAVRDIMSRGPFTGRLPIFLGDSGTDIPGMQVAKEFRGLAVAVGDTLPHDESLYDLRLDSIEETWELFKRWHCQLTP